MSTANKIMLVNDRVERAKSFLLTQFKDSPNINSLVDALVSELQELEKVVNDLQTVRTLEGSYGWWTDQIGNELDITRGSYKDDDFKTAIKIAMAKQTASASVEDILRIVSLITGDTNATVTNGYPYMMELYSWLYCVSESYSGLNSLAQLYPLNTRVRLVKHDVKPFTLGLVGNGFGSNATLCSLVYHRNGHSEDPRFVTTQTLDLPPVVPNAPVVVTAPYVYGNDTVGSTLTLVRGDYSGAAPLTYAYQWLRNGSNISGATALTYTIAVGDVSTSISCRVTVTNAAGNVAATSNNILVSSVVPPAATIQSDLGLDNMYASAYHPYDNTLASSTAEIDFKADGTVVRAENGTLANDTWAVTPVVGVGAGYRVYYQIVSGTALDNLAENVHHTLSTDITVSKTVSTKFQAIRTGQYKFYIYEIANPSNIVNKTISITAEVVSDL